MDRQFQSIRYVYSTPNNELQIATGVARVGINEYLKFAADIELYWAIYNKDKYLGTLETAFAYDPDAQQWDAVMQEDEYFDLFDGRTRNDWIQHHDEQELAA